MTGLRSLASAHAGAVLLMILASVLDGPAGAQEAARSRAVVSPGPSAAASTPAMPEVAIGPDDKSYIIAAANASAFRNAGGSVLPDWLVSVAGGATALSGAAQYDGQLTLSYLREGIDLLAFGVATNGGYYGGGVRYDVDIAGARRELFKRLDGAFQSAPPPVDGPPPTGFRLDPLSDSVRAAAVPWYRRTRLVLLSDYRDQDWMGSSWSAGFALSVLGAAKVDGRHTGGWRLSVAPRYSSQRFGGTTTSGDSVTVCLAYQDRLPELASNGQSQAEPLARWRTEVGIHVTPRYALSTGTVGGFYVRAKCGRAMARGGDARTVWSAYVRDELEFTFSAGIASDHKPYYGARVSFAFPGP